MPLREMELLPAPEKDLLRRLPHVVGDGLGAAGVDVFSVPVLHRLHPLLELVL